MNTNPPTGPTPSPAPCGAECPALLITCDLPHGHDGKHHRDNIFRWGDYVVPPAAKPSPEPLGEGAPSPMDREIALRPWREVDALCASPRPKWEAIKAIQKVAQAQIEGVPAGDPGALEAARQALADFMFEAFRASDQGAKKVKAAHAALDLVLGLRAPGPSLGRGEAP